MKQPQRILNEYTLHELLDLPNRTWEDMCYDSLIIAPVPSNDEEPGCIAIIGCFGSKPAEVCARQSNEIDWFIPATPRIPTEPVLCSEVLLGSGALHGSGSRPRYNKCHLALQAIN